MAKHSFIISILILIIAGALCKEKNEGEISVDPCIFTLCIANSTCLSYTDPSTCKHGEGIESCEKRAICVPTHSSARYCGFGGETCSITEKCELVQVECFTQPCPPLFMCVPINPHHPNIPVPLTRGGTKYSKFVIKDNHFYHIQRQNNKGRPQPSRLTSVTFNRS